MNILVPDSWLREYLDTDAEPHDLFTRLSLCGPSVERYTEILGDTVYDIEVTTNRVDAFSIYGIAREASVILPRFGFKAKLRHPDISELIHTVQAKPKLDIRIENDPSLCNRILAIKLSNISLGPSPDWMVKRLTQVGDRGLNNAIDITNYVAREIGHPLHAFDYDRLKEKKIIVRLARKGETLITLDHKKITLLGGEVVFDNGKGEIIDLPGIMGTSNSVVTNTTKNILLFSENTDAVRIRRTSMAHAIRSHAAQVNEKSPDPELAYISLVRALGLYRDLCRADISSMITDIYPNKPKSQSIMVSADQLKKYLGMELDRDTVCSILESLGFTVSISENNGDYKVTPPSHRAEDIRIAEDVIEEVARIHGYHELPTKLPDTEPPVTEPDSLLGWEEDIKIRLRDWGFTETYTYSMISEKYMDLFGYDKKKAYKLSNPLSRDWVYMRPSLWPSMLEFIAKNENLKESIRSFELSNVYEWQQGQLPIEKPMLILAWTGPQFPLAKGVAETLFKVFGIESPQIPDLTNNNKRYDSTNLGFGKYGSVGHVRTSLLSDMNIRTPVTILELNFYELCMHANPVKKYIPIPKYPPVIEDYTFTVPEAFHVGPLLAAIPKTDRLIRSAEIADTYHGSITVRVSYQHIDKNLTTEEIESVRTTLLKNIKSQFDIMLKE